MTRARVAGLALAAWLGACAATGPAREAATPPDAPPAGWPRPGAYVDAPSYADALHAWRTPEDVNAWIGARFGYDRSRALLLSASARARGATPQIRTPAEFFAAPTGVCVDVARFGVETLRAIDPGLRPHYLMIEFAPVSVGGETLRLHWVAGFRRGGGYYVFADSARPGHVAGPYASPQAFAEAYARERDRAILAFREAETFERRPRTAAPRAPKADAAAP
ncbi:MAG: hypothetical protein BroJett026_01070 [Betaproteobacteria bacterium]|nr:MAG: hypothetical protein BroJett026_01070 [Betaproteobacteria bacterium]